MNYNGERFLDVLYKDLYNSDEVLHTKKKNDSKEESISTYLNRLERIHNRINTKYKEALVKKMYFNKYVIKEKDIPSYIDDNIRKDIINNQKITLAAWIDYLSDKNAMYPVWAKYWVFRQVLNMGAYDELSGKYTKRNKKTRNAFVEVNPEVIAKCIENVIKLLGNEKKSTQEIRKLVSNISFEKLYTEYVNNYKEQFKSNEGIWVKYNKGSIEDAKKLSNSLQGYNTKWCTASENTAITQVKKGDFYVYYTKDMDGNYTVPRIAIRLNGNRYIGEIRGVEGFQNLEETMIPVLEKKLKEMTFLKEDDVNNYLQKIYDLKELQLIKRKFLNNEELMDQEIYDLYTKKFDFGYSDSVAEKIIKKRNFEQDYKKIRNLDAKLKVQFIKKNSVRFSYSGYDFIIEDREVLQELLNISGIYFKYASDKLKNDKEIVSLAIEKSGEWILQYASNKIKSDSDFILDLVKNNHHFLHYADKLLKDDIKFMLEAIKINENSFDYVSDRLRYNRNFIINALKVNPDLLKIARDRGIGKSFLKNREIVEIAIKKDPKLIKYIDYDLRLNKKFLIKKVKIYPKLFRYLPDELLKNRKFVLKGIKKNPYAGLYYFVGRFQYFLNQASKKL